MRFLALVDIQAQKKEEEEIYVFGNSSKDIDNSLLGFDSKSLIVF